MNPPSRAGHSPRRSGPADADDVGVADPELERFRRYANAPTPRGRHELIERHMGLAVHLAGHFARPGVGADDLRQTAMVGLVKAVDRFDPWRGSPFAPFARRVIEGELKRFLRDRSWSVRVPRAAQELHAMIRRGRETFTHEHGRAPTVRELATCLDLDTTEVLRGLAVSAAFVTSPLPDEASDGHARSLDVLAVDEPGYDALVDLFEVRSLLTHLEPRERRILELRFVDECTQSDIAEIVGISQMHVSRLLRRALERLRTLRSDAIGCSGGTDPPGPRPSTAGSSAAPPPPAPRPSTIGGDTVGGDAARHRS